MVASLITRAPGAEVHAALAVPENHSLELMKACTAYLGVPHA
jgi:hypothetical protein